MRKLFSASADMTLITDEINVLRKPCVFDNHIVPFSQMQPLRDEDIRMSYRMVTWPISCHILYVVRLKVGTAIKFYLKH